MAANTVDALAFWTAISRLGEAQILLPATLVAAVWVAWRRGATRLAGIWLAGTALAALLTTASKVAFIGFGIGHAALDFTGVSGHAMFAAAVLPVLLRLAEGSIAARWHGAGLVAGGVLAVLVAWSRVRLGVHSASEVVAGVALGGAVSALALWLSHAPRIRINVWGPLLLLGWAVAAMLSTPTLPTHGWVTSLSLAVSGRDHPYTRQEMRRAALQPPAAPGRALSD